MYNNIMTDKTEDVSRFKCDQCPYVSISNKGLRQYVEMKHKVSYVNGADDVEHEINPKSKKSKLENYAKEKKNKERSIKPEIIYEVKLGSNCNHIGMGTKQLSEFLEQLPSKAQHPEHGLGTFAEIDKDLGTFIYQFDNIKLKV